MNKTTLFMKAILGIGLAGAITLGASGCNSSSPNDIHRRELAGEMSVDAKRTFFNVYSFGLRADDNGYYIKFKGHYDNGGTSHELNPYKDHKDYEITYNITREKYLDISKICSSGEHATNNCSNELIKNFIEIVKEHDPISVTEYETNALSCQ